MGKKEYVERASRAAGDRRRSLYVKNLWSALDQAAPAIITIHKQLTADAPTVLMKARLLEEYLLKYNKPKIGVEYERELATYHSTGYFRSGMTKGEVVNAAQDCLDDYDVLRRAR